jgi:LysM repeat protein
LTKSRSRYTILLMADTAKEKNNIGIKLADGKFFPIFEENFKGRKRLILTTVRDNQQSVQIDLYKGSGDVLFEDLYLGSLVIENIEKAAKGEPEIELSIGIDKDGNLRAEANDFKSGERQSLSVSQESLENKDLYTIPEYEINQTLPDTASGEERGELEPETIVGETYPITDEDRRKTTLKKRKASPLLAILLILLGLALLAVVGWGVYSYLQKIPFLPGWDVLGATKGEAKESSIAEQKVEEETKTEEQAATEQKQEPAAETQKQEETAAPTEGKEYIVVRGDTLWDIARRYYRDPFEYKMLAQVNKIPNADLIFEKQKLFIPAK